jgi:hypothetical protein
MIVAVGYYAAALIKDVGVPIGVFEAVAYRVGHWSSADVSASYDRRGGQRTLTFLTCKHLRPSSATSDGPHGMCGLTAPSERRGVTGAMQGDVATSKTSLLRLIWTADIGSMP